MVVRSRGVIGWIARIAQRLLEQRIRLVVVSAWHGDGAGNERGSGLCLGRHLPSVEMRPISRLRRGLHQRLSVFLPRELEV